MKIFITSSNEQIDTATEIASCLEKLNVESLIWNDVEAFINFCRKFLVTVRKSGGEFHIGKLRIDMIQL